MIVLNHRNELQTEFCNEHSKLTNQHSKSNLKSKLKLAEHTLNSHSYTL